MQSMLANDDQCKLVVQKYLEEQEQARLLAQQSMGEDTEKLQAELKRQQSTQNVLVQKILDEVKLSLWPRSPNWLDAWLFVFTSRSFILVAEDFCITTRLTCCIFKNTLKIVWFENNIEIKTKGGPVKLGIFWPKLIYRTFITWISMFLIGH